jgi:hypothetical protein
MSANQTSFPGAVDTAPANLAHAGRMPRWAVRSSTIAGFLTQRVVGHDDIYVPLATASLAGALSAADFAKLATLQVPTLRLSYTANTDLMNATAIAATTWTDLHANQSFTVASTASWFLVSVRLGLVATTGAGNPELAARALFDSAGSALGVNFAAGMIGGTWEALSGNAFLLSAGTFAATGTHTIKIQVYGNAAWTAYCRTSSQPNTEFASITIAELNT